MMGISHQILGSPSYTQGLNAQATAAEAQRRYNDAIRQAAAQQAKNINESTVPQAGDLIEGEFTVVTEGGSIANSTGEESSGVQAQRAIEDHSSNTDS